MTTTLIILAALIVFLFVVRKRIRINKTNIHRDDNEIYMTRWRFDIHPYISFKLHKIMLSDYDCMHDHPWAFISIILRGGYVEHTVKGSKIIHPFSIIKRSAEHKHRLEIHQTCWTFVICSKRVREWGFWNSKGFTKWFEYKPQSKCD